MIKKGDIFIFTTGRYSDYEVYAILRAECDFCIEDVESAIKKDKFGRYRTSEVLKFITDKYCTELEGKEFYIDDFKDGKMSYGDMI